MDLFNLEISLKWMNIIKISKKTILKKKFNFRIYITWKSMHYWLLQVVYDSINFDSYFISVKGPLKKSRGPILQPTFSCHKNLLPCANVHNISTKVEFFKAKKNSAAHVYTSGGLRKWI